MAFTTVTVGDPNADWTEISIVLEPTPLGDVRRAKVRKSMTSGELQVLVNDVLVTGLTDNERESLERYGQETANGSLDLAYTVRDIADRIAPD